MDISKENKRKKVAKKIPVGKVIPEFTLMGNRMWGRCISVYDGDTLHAGFLVKKHPFQFTIRLNGIDTPEMRTKNLKEKDMAIAARDHLRSLILDKVVYFMIHDFDKYGRLLADIYITDKESKSVTDMMLEAGHGYSYNGGKKTKVNFTD